MSTATSEQGEGMRYPLDMAIAAALLVFVLCCIVKLALN